LSWVLIQAWLRRCVLECLGTHGCMPSVWRSLFQEVGFLHNTYMSIYMYIGSTEYGVQHVHVLELEFDFDVEPVGLPWSFLALREKVDHGFIVSHGLNGWFHASPYCWGMGFCLVLLPGSPVLGAEVYSWLVAGNCNSYFVATHVPGNIPIDTVQNKKIKTSLTGIHSIGYLAPCGRQYGETEGQVGSPLDRVGVFTARSYPG
jgi:hypothetical protein